MLIVGLGNPGREYKRTRHNLGFMVVDAFARRHGLRLKEQSKFHGQVARGHVGGQAVELLKPMTYMNESGRAVRSCGEYYKIAPSEVLVVCDDVALPFEKMRFRQRGSHGGHRGLESIEQHLGTRDYMRLRLGVGRGETALDLSDYVLEPFTKEEEKKLESYVDRAVDTLERLIQGETGI